MYLCDSEGNPYNSKTFDMDAYLSEAVPDERLLDYPEGRRVLTRLDPLLFGLIYCRELLKDREGNVSFADLHLSLCRMALDWLRRPEPRDSRNAFIAPRGLGKALALDTPIPTPCGWTTMGSLEVGDQVFDKDGNPTTVVNATEIMYDHRCFKVVFSDGSEVVADEDHNWWVKDRRDGAFHTKTTGELSKDFEQFSASGKRDRNYSVPVAGPVRYPEKDHAIHPYVLGAWLGDGSNNAAVITSSRCDVDEMESKLSDCGEHVTRFSYSSGNFGLRMTRKDPDRCVRGHPYSDRAGRGNPCRVCVAQHMKNQDRLKKQKDSCPPSPRINEPLVVRLRELGVLNNKHIPSQYLQGSVEQRMELLRGLMDTDGTVSTRGTLSYSGTNKRLVQDVLALVLSLGIRATMSEGVSKLNGRVYGACYTVNFTTSEPVFNLRRKLDRITTSTGREKGRTIVSVYEVDTVPVRCIQVDNPDHLFQCGFNHIVTKNSTWAFKILPLWAAAHGHLEFIAAFSSSASQAQTHLAGFKRQLDTNVRLREDFPDLCSPAKRPSGNNVADSQEMYYAKSRFSFAARGLDSEVLGLVDPLNRRPDGILLDDIEPDESNYSVYLKRKRLSTIIDTIFPMNEQAHVMLIGTVTMPESIVHELVKTQTTNDRPPDWITAERFKVHYIRPIIAEDDGTERSVWPTNSKWSLEYLQSIRHTHSFKKNLDNQPVGVDGQYWSESDFRYGDVEATRVLLQIDPAVTSKRNADYTALAVVAYEPGAVAGNKGVEYFPRCAVRHIEGVRLPPAKLRDRVLRILERFPEIGAVRIEVNQGGDTWKSVFHDLPVQLAVHTETIPKKTRAEHLLNHYQRERVLHVKSFPGLEEQMVSFPHVLNDDLIDAVGAAVQYFLAPKTKARGRSLNYVRN